MLSVLSHLPGVGAKSVMWSILSWYINFISMVKAYLKLAISKLSLIIVSNASRFVLNEQNGHLDL